MFVCMYLGGSWKAVGRSFCVRFVGRLAFVGGNRVLFLIRFVPFLRLRFYPSQLCSECIWHSWICLCLHVFFAVAILVRVRIFLGLAMVIFVFRPYCPCFCTPVLSYPVEDVCQLPPGAHAIVKHVRTFVRSSELNRRICYSAIVVAAKFTSNKVARRGVCSKASSFCVRVQVIQTVDVYGGDPLAQIAVYLFNPGQQVHSYKHVCDIGTEFQKLNGPESSLEIIGGNPSGTGCWNTTITCPGNTPTHFRIYPNLHTKPKETPKTMVQLTLMYRLVEER